MLHVESKAAYNLNNNNNNSRTVLRDVPCMFTYERKQPLHSTLCHMPLWHPKHERNFRADFALDETINWNKKLQNTSMFSQALIYFRN